MGLKTLIDHSDQSLREELGEYVIISKSRIENLVDCFESGAKTIQELTQKVSEQQQEISRLSIMLLSVNDINEGR